MKGGMSLYQERTKVSWMLVHYNLTQVWLLNRLAMRGIEITKVNLSDILRGIRRNALAEQVVTESLSILNDYEKWEIQEFH